MSDDIDPFATPGPSKGIVAGTSDDSSDPFSAPGPSSGIVNPRKSDALAGSAFHAPLYASQELVKGIVNTPPQLAAIGDSFTSWLQSHMPSYFSAKAPETPESKALVEGMNKTNSAQPLFPGLAEAVNAKLSTLQPQGVGEDYLGAGARGVGSAIASLPLTGGAAVLPQIAAGGGGGIASEAAEKLAPGTWWAPVVIGLAGGLTAGAGIHMLSNWAGLRAAKAAVESTASDLAKAREVQLGLKENQIGAKESQLGTPLTDFDTQQGAKAATAAEIKAHEDAKVTAIAASRQVQDDAIGAAKDQINDSKSQLNVAQNAHDDAVAKSAANRDGIVGIANERIGNSKNNLDSTLDSLNARQTRSVAQQKADVASAENGITKIPDEDISVGLKSIADKHGTSAEYDDAGKIGQANARNFLTPQTGTLATREAAEWQPLDSAMSDKAPPDLAPFESFMAKVGERGGALKEVLSQFVPNNAGRVKAALGRMNPDETEQAMGAEPAIASWKDVRQLRSAVGEVLSDPMLLKSIGRQNAEGAYGTLTKILQDAADENGLGDAFAKANSVSESNRQFVEGPLAKLVSGARPSSGSEPTWGGAAKSILDEGKTTGQTLQALRAEPTTSPFVDELASLAIRRASEDPKEWQKLSAGAKAALVPDPMHRAQIETLLADKGRTIGDSAPAIKAAHDTHLANLEQIEAERAAAKIAHQQNVLAAKRDIDLAKNDHKTNAIVAKAGLTAAKAQHEANVAKLAGVISSAKAAHNADKQQITSAAQRAIDDARARSDIIRTEIARKRIQTAEENERASLEAQRAGLGVSHATIAAQAAKAKLDSYRLAPSQHGINALLGADLGEHAGELAHHALGLTGVPHHLSALVGAAVPAVIRFGKRVLTNPQNAVNSLVGGEAGAQGASNPLTGNRSQ